MLIAKVNGFTNFSALQKTQSFGKNNAEFGYFNTLNSISKLKKQLGLVENELIETKKLKEKRKTEIEKAKRENNSLTADVLSYNYENLQYDEIISYLNEEKTRLEREISKLKTKKNH